MQTLVCLAPPDRGQQLKIDRPEAWAGVLFLATGAFSVQGSGRLYRTVVQPASELTGLAMSFKRAVQAIWQNADQVLAQQPCTCYI